MGNALNYVACTVAICRCGESCFTKKNQAYIAEKRGGKHRDSASLAQKQAIDENLEDLSHDELMTMGKEGYLKHCAVCHQANGKDATHLPCDDQWQSHHRPA